MSKRKTDEQRAGEWVLATQRVDGTRRSVSDAMALSITTAGFCAGLRSERRAIKRKQTAKAEALLSGYTELVELARDCGDVAGKNTLVSKMDAMREAFTALGLKVNP